MLQLTQDIVATDRYNVERWLDLEEEALKFFHPQHQVVMEVAKWLVPILCRSPTRLTESFSPNLLKRKMSLLSRQLAVMTIVDPGYSKTRAKALYEFTETKLFLTFQNIDTSDMSLATIILKQAMIDLPDIINVMEKLEPNEGFETVLVAASKNMVMRCRIILQQIKEKKSDYSGCDWGKGWSLLQLFNM